MSMDHAVAAYVDLPRYRSPSQAMQSVRPSASSGLYTLRATPNTAFVYLTCTPLPIRGGTKYVLLPFSLLLLPLS